MEEIPDFWRTEVFHPLSVHFPIAILIVAFLFKLIAFRSVSPTWSTGGTVLLFLGTLGAWVAVYTGNLADGIVSRKICDPTILKDHENFAYATSWFFTAALATDLIRQFKAGFIVSKAKLFKIFTALLMFIGVILLIYVGHMGATLVYQQGAGVYHPSPDCAEFE